ncbi:LptE family protein [Paracidobacterium acidisoli]|uniref:Longin domain-containing protein n=1 Tax=Paracidobacterium acidisoli TaxID=2303751 RepID=A0A372IMK6_9BACT|nr:LptE family protein [Paracidobacterium acidisoli]MBT9331738.1 LptE family protein [Paracidobacterium acidisoli]
MHRVRAVAPSACLLFCLMVISGCGYHTVNSAVHLPQTVHTLAIPSFRNNTQSYHTEIAFTEAVIREFNTRTSYHIVTNDDAAADATLKGTIIGYQVTPLTYNNTTGESSSFLITITAKLTLTDREHRVLYQNGSYVFRQQYQETTNLASFIQEDSAATRRLSRDFAEAAVSDILESF